MTPPASIYLSVVIPAYNEERRIGPTLLRIGEYLNAQPYASEVIVVDDGSQDGTCASVWNHNTGRPPVHVLRNTLNRGKGFAVRSGMLSGRGDYLLLSDADLSTPIEEVEKLIPWMHSGFDVVIGSRGLPSSVIQVRQAWYRERMGKFFNRLVRALLLPDIFDTQCGFKLFRRNAALTIFLRQRLNGFCFDVEALWLAQKYGYRIKEVPIVWYNDKQSRVRPVADAARMLFDLIRIRAGDLRSCYADKRNCLRPAEEGHVLEEISRRHW